MKKRKYKSSRIIMTIRDKEIGDRISIQHVTNCLSFHLPTRANRSAILILFAFVPCFSRDQGKWRIFFDIRSSSHSMANLNFFFFLIRKRNKLKITVKSEDKTNFLWQLLLPLTMFVHITICLYPQKVNLRIQLFVQEICLISEIIIGLSFKRWKYTSVT